MIQLNYSDLSDETQKRLLQQSIKDVERKFGEDIYKYAKTYCLNFDALVEEEAQRNLYSYRYEFRP